jgi:hypothetical protein
MRRGCAVSLEMIAGGEGRATMNERRLLLAAMICVALSAGPAVWLILGTLAPANFNAALGAMFAAIFLVMIVVIALAWRYGRLTGVVPSRAVKTRTIGAIAVGCAALYLLGLVSTGAFDPRLNIALSLALGALFGAALVWIYAWLAAKSSKGAAVAVLIAPLCVWPPLILQWRGGWSFVMPFFAGILAVCLVTWIVLRRSANDSGAVPR